MEATAVLAVIRAARPAFRDRADRVAFALHALLLVRGARLIAIGQAAEAEPPAGALAAEECGHDGWNAAEGTWAFRYVLGGSVVTFKALLMGDRFLADVARGTDGKAASVDVRRAPRPTRERARAPAAPAAPQLPDGLSSEPLKCYPSHAPFLPAASPSTRRARRTPPRPTPGSGISSLPLARPWTGRWGQGRRRPRPPRSSSSSGARSSHGRTSGMTTRISPAGARGGARAGFGPHVGSRRGGFLRNEPATDRLTFFHQPSHAGEGEAKERAQPKQPPC